MVSVQPYPPAQVVAARIAQHIATDSYEYGRNAEPDANTLAQVINAGFWASLLREEGREPRISLACLPPEATPSPLSLWPRLPLEPKELAHLAPAVERPGIHLGVWCFDGRLEVWGTTRQLPPGCFVLEVAGPGLLVAKLRRPEPSTKFANLAVLQGADVRFIVQQESLIEDAPAALSPLLAFYATAGSRESDTVLVRLAISMREHGSGGTLLVVPEGDDWRASIVQPPAYAAGPGFAELRSLLERCRRDGAEGVTRQIRDAVAALAGLTAVDGATVINEDFELLAFGAKILMGNGRGLVDRVLLTQPIEGMAGQVLSAAQIGGTRHLSAAQFVYEQRSAIAMVASQDGRFTVFAWSQPDELVHAHRLEDLLM